MISESQRCEWALGWNRLRIRNISLTINKDRSRTFNSWKANRGDLAFWTNIISGRVIIRQKWPYEQTKRSHQSHLKWQSISHRYCKS